MGLNMHVTSIWVVLFIRTAIEQFSIIVFKTEPLSTVEKTFPVMLSLRAKESV